MNYHKIMVYCREVEYAVTTFYKFMPLDKGRLEDIKELLEKRAKEMNILGLILIAPEGINATVAGHPVGITRYKEMVSAEFGEMKFKDSESNVMPFKRFKVKIKDEIVQLHRTDLRPTGSEPHLSPEQWDAMIAAEDVLLIDVRNAYETKIGTFKNAVDPQTESFSEFPEWLQESNIPKHQKIGIFCTGGIRCDKAVVAMKEQGYDEVYQLDGGILNYLEKKPNSNFEGECFVFDHRVAVQQNLQPSAQYKLCVRCGNAGNLTPTCEQCQDTFPMCTDCADMYTALCSKECRYHYAQATAQ